MPTKNYKYIKQIDCGLTTLYQVKSIIDQKIYLLQTLDISHHQNKEKNRHLQTAFLSKIQSPQLLAINNFIQEDQKLKLIMEYLCNGSLKQKINHCKDNKTSIDESSIWKILYQIILGLNFLHEQNIVHGSLQSVNIFFDKEESVKIGDYNKSIIRKSGLELQDSLAKTTIYTPYYSSPEQFNDERITYKTDIWHLGCIVYEMATLKVPFDGNNIEQLYRRIMKGIYKPISQNYSQELRNIINIMLKTNPKKRLSAGDLLTIIQQMKRKLNIKNQSIAKQQKIQIEIDHYNNNNKIKQQKVKVKVDKLEEQLKLKLIGKNIAKIYKKKQINKMQQYKDNQYRKIIKQEQQKAVKLPRLN